MLRNHCCWTWRLFAAFLFLLFFYNPTARGGPLFGLPPCKPGVPGGSKPPAYPAPDTYTISGYVYIDSAQNGARPPNASGISAVQMQLTDTNKAITYTAYTNSAGYYIFGSLTPGDVYTLKEIQPSRYTSTLDTVGYFLSSTGGTLAAPPGSSNGILAPPDTISNIALPLPTGAFAPSTTGGKYAAVNYLFGESAPKPPPPPGPGVNVAILSTNLAVSGSNNRFLAGPGGGSLSLTGTVKNSATPNSSSLSWQISSLLSSPGMSLTPSASTNIGPGKYSILTGTISGASLLPGTQNATLAVLGTNLSPNKPLPTSFTNAVIDPVLSRGSDATSALSVTGANFGRIMLGGTASANLTVTSTGSHDRYSDLTMNVGSLSGSDSNGTFSGTNSAAVTFNGTTTTSSGITVNATFSALGPISSTAAIPGNTGLFTGETLATGGGTPVLPTLKVPYTATVLQQRQLAPAAGGPTTPFDVPTTAGGLLYGAVVSIPTGYSVTSTSDSNHVTSVYVTGGSNGIADAVSTSDGTTLVGLVGVTQTLINSAGTTIVPVTVEAGNWGQISGSASLSVVTAEAASVHDTKAYNPVSVAYNIANVGYAATGGSDTVNNNPNKQLFGAPLSAPFNKGAQLSPSALGGSQLSSFVAYVGTAGTNSTAMNTVNTDTIWAARSSGGTVDSSNAHGTVGSQCDILASTALSSSATVTMAWRNRDNAENGSFTDPSWSTKLPTGIQWLNSDVVDIAGVPSDLTFAMQMVFDDGINVLLEHPSAPGTMDVSYIGKMVNGKWENAVAANNTNGIHRQTAVASSLSAFLQQQMGTGPGENGYTLDQLAGSWGADLSNPGGVEYSWTIVNGGGGEFAVVPEPSTLALLGASVVGLLIYRVRRKARCASKEV